MKLSLNWLRKFIDLPETATEIGEKITIHTAELEEVIETNKLFSQIFVGKLIAIEEKDDPKGQLGIFNIGNNITKRIFIYDSFFEVGRLYPLVFKNEPKRENEGFVVNNNELGMKNDGTMHFLNDKYIGKNLTEVSNAFSDILFDIDNKSLTHRPDLMGHLGFVRELQTIYGKNKNFVPTFDLPKISTDKKISVDIQTKNCKRFMAVECANIQVKNSGIETTVLLENLGTRAISNVVDITNLSLLGLGQPMHAFDADKIEGKIIIRMAKAGEKLLALDEIEYELQATDIVIADEKKILSIAGIMGGLSSSVTKATKNIVFESASFDSTIIRKTSARLGLRSESSMRFEKTLDPINCEQGLAFALVELNKICPEVKISSQITDKFPHPYKTKSIEISESLFSDYAGTKIESKFIAETLQSLGFKNHKNGKNLVVTVPSWRATKDVSIAQDLVEEVIRMFGYHNISTTLPILPLTPPKANLERQFEWKIRDFWSNNDFFEVVLSSFVQPNDADLIEDDSHITMMNAGNAETTFLRKNLASNLLRNIEPELRKYQTVSFFELGHTYHGFENENNILGVIQATLNQKRSENNFFILQSNIQKFLQKIGFTPMQIRFAPAKNVPALAHPHQVADILVKNKLIGQIYTIHPAKNNIKKSTIVLAEINIANLHTEIKNVHKVLTEISPFPIMQRDISLLMDEKISMKNLETLAFENSNNMISFELFDEYKNAEKLGKNIKNLAFHLQFQSKTETLSSDQVELEVGKILQIFATKYKAQQRD